MKVAVVLGGALRANGELSKYVQNRCLQAVNCEQKFDYYIASSRYTLNVPPKLEQNGHIIYENKKISDYLKYLGIPSDQIIMESSSSMFVLSCCCVCCKLNEPSSTREKITSSSVMLIAGKEFLRRSRSRECR